MKVVIGSDHAGFERKEFIINWLESNGYEVVDKGTYSDASVDYPDYAHQVALEVQNKNADHGVLICGSANGVAMSANKHSNVRAALCWEAEIASLARLHNDANVCCIPARFINEAKTVAILVAYFSAKFEGGRHEKRVNKIACS
ncbi:MAG: ribose 5-phosphate isomerase B [Flavobacteriales bacterium]|jgi:ribose 5-phosphate isomerase B